MRIRTATPIALAAATALAGSLLATAAPASAAAHQGGLHFGFVQYDGPGKDNRSTKSLNAEWVNIHNN
ncbi:lamin tail domain-containing protein, partial [Streptomyces sp. SID7499]|nr:lamin tail domain-containing protein [Streptomyces sp. SID7499]